MGYTAKMELYHVINRGIDGRRLFLDSGDYVRFVHNMYEFNDAAPAIGLARRDQRDANVGLRKSYIRKLLVKVHGWCLMKDHYHLLLSELVDGGLAAFMRKINVGYANYYNGRYERHGHLLQGKTKKILLGQQAHFLYVLHYIHLNPLDYLPGVAMWRERDKSSIESPETALNYLNRYRWSSYLDYCGTRNFPSILITSHFSNAFGEPYHSALRSFLKDREEPGLDIKHLEY